MIARVPGERLPVPAAEASSSWSQSHDVCMFSLLQSTGTRFQYCLWLTHRNNWNNRANAKTAWKQLSKLQKKFVWEKYPPWEIWPIYTININDSCLKSSSEARRWVCVTVMMVGSRVPALYCHSSLHCLVLSHRWCWGTNLPCICYHDLEHCC